MSIKLARVLFVRSVKTVLQFVMNPVLLPESVVDVTVRNDSFGSDINNGIMTNAKIDVRIS